MNHKGQRDNDGVTVHSPWTDRSRSRNQWNHWNRPGSCLLYWPINRPRRWEERPLRGREKFSIYVLKMEKVNMLKSHRINVTLNRLPKISTRQVFNVSYKMNSRCVDQSAVYLYVWKKKKPEAFVLTLACSPSFSAWGTLSDREVSVVYIFFPTVTPQAATLRNIATLPIDWTRRPRGYSRLTYQQQLSNLWLQRSHGSDRRGLDTVCVLNFFKALPSFVRFVAVYLQKKKKA